MYIRYFNDVTCFLCLRLVNVEFLVSRCQIFLNSSSNSKPSPTSSQTTGVTSDESARPTTSPSTAYSGEPVGSAPDVGTSRDVASPERNLIAYVSQKLRAKGEKYSISYVACYLPPQLFASVVLIHELVSLLLYSLLTVCLVEFAFSG